jgi:hypothetical protein
VGGVHSGGRSSIGIKSPESSAAKKSSPSAPLVLLRRCKPRTGGAGGASSPEISAEGGAEGEAGGARLGSGGGACARGMSRQRRRHSQA